MVWRNEEVVGVFGVGRRGVMGRIVEVVLLVGVGGGGSSSGV